MDMVTKALSEDDIFKARSTAINVDRQSIYTLLATKSELLSPMMRKTQKK
jgi:hypothetical protein